MRELPGDDDSLEPESATPAPFSGAAPVLVVGLVPGQSERVPLAAADLAERLGAELVCAHVDAMRYVVREAEEGMVSSLPIDPDLEDEAVDAFEEELDTYLDELFAGRPLRWSVRTLAGEPAGALTRLAETLNAQAIVVGTRYASFRAGLQDLFGGSVALRLAHRQSRPVIVIPSPRTTHGADTSPIEIRDVE